MTALAEPPIGTVAPPAPPAAQGTARSRRRVALPLASMGPAFVAGIAYVDPGNVATNFEAGSRFGYGLLWVVVAANLVAALMQSLAAKLGLASGLSLAEATRLRFRPRAVRLLWLQAETVAVATDVAEIVGGAIALDLLFGLPLLAGALVTGCAACALLALRDAGRRLFESAVVVLFVVIAIGFCYTALAAAPDHAQLLRGLKPGFAGRNAAVLATAIVGATVMPHALYVHSALTRGTLGAGTPAGVRAPRSALRMQRIDIGVAMGTAGVVNVAMLVTAAAALPGVGGGIPGFHAGLGRALGGTAALVFVLALLASGLASSGVGTYAGEEIMAGHLQRRIPRAVRRGVTIVPCLALLSCGVSATDALVLSQLVLGLGVPIALGTLLVLTRDRAVMGELVNRRATTALAAACACAVAGIGMYSLLATCG